MKTLSASVAAAGVAILLSGCVYYPDGPYGPGYGPYHRATYDQPPPPPPAASQDNYGGPPNSYGPQGGYDGAPPDASGPPDDGGYGPQAGGPGGSGAMGNSAESKADKAMRHINNPKWCAKHQEKCDKLRAKYGAPDQAPPDQSQY